MILPLRVLGRPATNWILSGLVMGLISAQTNLVKSMAIYRPINPNRIPARLYEGKYLIERDQLLMFKSNYDPRPGRKRSPRSL